MIFTIEIMNAINTIKVIQQLENLFIYLRELWGKTIFKFNFIFFFKGIYQTRAIKIKVDGLRVW